MMRLAAILTASIVLIFLNPLEGRAEASDTTDLTGQWYGVWWDPTNDYSTNPVAANFMEEGGSGSVTVDVPTFGLFATTFPFNVVGNEITIGDPSVLGFTGIVTGDTISGECWQESAIIATWYAEKESGALFIPGPAPGPECDDLPEMTCFGGTEYCGELILFEPAEGPGYVDMPGYLETWDDQAYSFLRRDLVQLIKYATAKVDCKTAGWDFGNHAPLVLGDMSESDGSTPGTNVGFPFHPPGTHVNGRDIDTAYYQLFSPDNLLRPIGEHFIDTTDQYHLVGEPYALDRWRTALYIAYLSEHPNLRVIGVDGQVGVVLDATLDELVGLGWIDEGLRDSIPLVYEVTDEGYGFFLYHHHHMHISIDHLGTISAEPDQAPAITQLLGCYPNPFNPRTTVSFWVDHPQVVELSIFDLSGKLVAVLADRTFQTGQHSMDWEGRDLQGNAVASGTYLLRMASDVGVAVEKMMLIR